MSDTSPSAGSGGTGSGTASGTGASGVSGVGGTSGGGSGGGSGQGNGGGDGGGGSKPPVGAIVGGTLGGVAFIVLLAILLFFCLKRRSKERRESNDSSLIKNYGIKNGAGTEKRNRLDILAGGGASRRDGGLGRAGSDSEARATGAEYQPVPFRYPSPPPGSEGGRNPAPPTSFPVMAASKEHESRQSFESGNTNTTTQNGNGNGSTPLNTSIAAGTTAAGSQAGRTDDATVGHGNGNGVQRGASTRKTGITSSPAAPANASGPRRGVDEMPSDDGARIVQHLDEGPVV
jgi:hypothetical protein